MRCFYNAGTPAGISAAACKQSSLIVETDVVHKSKIIVRYRLLKGPEKIIGRGHEQCTVLDGVFFISSKWGIIVLLGKAVEALNKGFQLRRYRPEIQRRRKNNAVCRLYLCHKLIKNPSFCTHGLPYRQALQPIQPPTFYFARKISSTLCPFSTAPFAKLSAS